jgi:hypothetical protein
MTAANIHAGPTRSNPYQGRAMNTLTVTFIVIAIVAIVALIGLTQSVKV